MKPPTKQINFPALKEDIKQWGGDLGFQQIGITNTDLAAYEPHFKTWLEKQYHGDMEYMQKHGSKRTHPDELVPGTIRIITARMNYLPPQTAIIKNLQNSNQAYISRYAVGGDYHKLLRKRLTLLAKKITTTTGEFGYRAFCDSAPVLEKPLAEKSGLGWIGKNTLLLNQKAGSWFFLGVLFTDLPLPIDSPSSIDQCGQCTACINICPTQAIVAPYVLDARRCISYLTIELKEAIPVELRPLMGNRIYGCDDCQLVCPWNRYAKATDETQFHPRHALDSRDLTELFLWSEQEFLQKTEGSAIRRIGYQRWLRNLAVALGNAAYSSSIVQALQSRLETASDMVCEHILWALERQTVAKKADPLLQKLKKCSRMNEEY
jgi:epoxyqueuosine reductase